MSDPATEPRYCPFCGQPLGSFFGNRLADGSRWCEHCQESFRVLIVNLDEGWIPSLTKEPHDKRHP